MFDVAFSPGCRSSDGVINAVRQCRQSRRPRGRASRGEPPRACRTARTPGPPNAGEAEPRPFADTECRRRRRARRGEESSATGSSDRHQQRAPQCATPRSPAAARAEEVRVADHDARDVDFAPSASSDIVVEPHTTRAVGSRADQRHVVHRAQIGRDGLAHARCTRGAPQHAPDFGRRGCVRSSDAAPSARRRHGRGARHWHVRESPCRAGST